VFNRINVKFLGASFDPGVLHHQLTFFQCANKAEIIVAGPDATYAFFS